MIIFSRNTFKVIHSLSSNFLEPGVIELTRLLYFSGRLELDDDFFGAASSIRIFLSFKTFSKPVTNK